MVRTINRSPLNYTGKVLATNTRQGDMSVNRNGVATLSSGVVTVIDPILRLNEQIFLSKNTQIGAGAGILTVTARTNGKEFDVSALDEVGVVEGDDDSIINFVIVPDREDP